LTVALLTVSVGVIIVGVDYDLHCDGRVELLYVSITWDIKGAPQCDRFRRSTEKTETDTHVVSSVAPTVTYGP
jgi:hypothetical protein